jgi:hypothetical protein
MIPLMRIAHSMGYESTQIMVIQHLVGVLALGFVVVCFSRRRDSANP